MKYALILVCAGRGRRLEREADKAFVELGKYPLFYYSYRIFKDIKGISQIIIVAREKYFYLIRRYVKDRRIFLTKGGKRRQDSVYKGLKLINDDIEYVFIHDGARPFITKGIVERLKKEVSKFHAVVPALKINEAIKIAEKGIIKKSLDRNTLWLVQTPQVFRKSLILKAYEEFNKKYVYDDSELVSFLNRRVKIIEGERCNLKITYPKDLTLAEMMLKSRHRVK